MTRLSAVILWLMLLGLSNSAWAQAPAQVPAANSCIECHADIWDEVKESIHAKEGISCQDCHGGDAAQKDKELAKAPGTGYLGIPDKKQLVEVCGTCHANVAVMNSYGIPTDQLAQYKTSVHGKRLLDEGDNRTAACADCHGYHNVVPVKDPASPVYPLNLPDTCNRCHGNHDLMSRYGRPSDIFERYKKSVHGQALFEKKDLSVAQCASCHGSHGAVPPGVKTLGAVCGKCHVNEAQDFLESPHAGAARAGKFSECISCHSNHDVQPASLDLYREACGKCHDVKSSAFGMGREFTQMLGGSRQMLEQAKAQVRQASIEGIFVEEESAALNEAKTDFTTLAPLQHTLSRDKISALYQKVLDKVKEIQEGIHKKRKSLRWRKIALIPIWIFVLVMVVSFWIKFKRLKGK